MTLAACLLWACGTPESEGDDECGLNSPCPTGYTCDPVERRCIVEAVVTADASPDAARPDAAAPDAAAPDAQAAAADAAPPDAPPPDAPPGAPILALASQTVDLGAVVLGLQSPEVQLVASNTGTAPTGPLAVSVTGADAAQFSVTGCAGVSLAAGATCTLRLRFTPTTLGALTATLSVTAPGSTATATLGGTSLRQGALASDAVTKDFGATVLQTPGEEAVFTIRNTGDTPIAAVSAKLKDGLDFTLVAVDGACGGALAPMATCKVKVRFEPSAGGTRSDTLVVSDAPDGGSVTVSLTGLGLEPALVTMTSAGFDFGSLVVGGSAATTELTVRNDGEAPSGTPSVKLTSSSTFKIVTNGCSGPIAPGGSCIIKVSFTPSDPPGTKTATLTVSVDPGGSAVAMLSGVVLSPGALVVTPGDLPFGAVALGQTAKKTFQLSNSGQSPTGTLAVGVTGSDAASFTISANPCPTTLAAGAKCDLEVTFGPTAVGVRAATLTAGATPGGAAAVTLGGTGTAQLTVEKTGTGTGSVTSEPAGISCGATCVVSFSDGLVVLSAAAGPLSDFVSWSGAGCSGNGTCEVTMDGAKKVTATFDLKPPALTLSPPSVDFGGVALGDAATPATFTVENDGGSESGVLSASVDDTQSYAVTGGTCPGAKLAAGDSCTVIVTFAPAGAAGSKPAVLTVGGSLMSSLAGTALEPALLSISPSSFDFGMVGVNAASTEKVFTVTNDGEAPSGGLSYAVDTTHYEITSNNCPAQLAAGASCSVGVTFTPLQPGTLTGRSLTVTADPGGMAAASLVGTGFSQVTVVKTEGGKITSSMPTTAIDCGSTCSAAFTAGPVYLLNAPDANHALTGFSNCTTNGIACVVGLGSAAISVEAMFHLIWTMWTPAEAPAFTTTADTATDGVTGLVWQRAVTAGVVTWPSAKTYCANLTQGGSSLWRLPSRVELLSIVDYAHANPALDTAVFTTTPTDFPYWTASQDARVSTNAWLVSLNLGGATAASKQIQGRALCVR